MSNQEDLDALAANLGGRLDGVVHSIAYAPPSCLGGGFLDAPWEDVAVALQVSAYSLKALAVAALPLMQARRLDRRASTSTARRAFPVYDWMGVAKSALAVGRHGSSPATSGAQGIRVNLIAAGPSRSLAARSIPGYEVFEDVWNDRAPLGWDTRDADPIAKALRRAPVRLVPRHHRRDHPRRRRLPRHRRLIVTRCGADTCVTDARSWRALLRGCRCVTGSLVRVPR